jgi:hypothetical protein
MTALTPAELVSIYGFGRALNDFNLGADRVFGFATDDGERGVEFERRLFENGAGLAGVRLTGVELEMARAGLLYREIIAVDDRGVTVPGAGFWPLYDVVGRLLVATGEIAA